MRGVTKLPLKNIIKQIYPLQIMETQLNKTEAISTPSRRDKNNEHGTGLALMNSTAVAAFDKPRLPPVLGPLVLLSLLEMASSGDGRDN